MRNQSGEPVRQPWRRGFPLLLGPVGKFEFVYATGKRAVGVQSTRRAHHSSGPPRRPFFARGQTSSKAARHLLLPPGVRPAERIIELRARIQLLHDWSPMLQSTAAVLCSRRAQLEQTSRPSEGSTFTSTSTAGSEGSGTGRRGHCRGPRSALRRRFCWVCEPRLPVPSGPRCAV